MCSLLTYKVDDICLVGNKSHKMGQDSKKLKPY